VVELIRRRGARARGLHHVFIQEKLDSGEWIRLCPGVFARAGEFAQLTPADQHLALIEAVLPCISPDAALSHISAAVARRWSLWRPDLTKVHITRSRSNGGRSAKQMVVHSGSIAGEIEEVYGYTVTSAARTVLDIARTLPFEEAVVIGDSAVRNEVDLRVDDLRELLEAAGPRPGLRAARRAIAFLDPLAANAAESRARVFFHINGFPAPVTQFRIERGNGQVYFADFKFDDPTGRFAGILGELDGKIKYSGIYGAPGDIFYDEKTREDEIRAAGYAVFRFGVADLAAPGKMLRHMKILGLEPGLRRAA
jgi:hypothetical protein